MNTATSTRRRTRQKLTLKNTGKKRTINTLSLKATKLEPKNNIKDVTKKVPIPQGESKATPTKAPKKNVHPETSLSKKCNTLNKRLRHDSKIWKNKIPLKIGVHEDIMRQYTPEFSKAAVRMMVRSYVMNPDYLENVAKGGHRYNLDGSISGKVEDKEAEHAKRLLDASAGNKDEIKLIINSNNKSKNK